MDILNMQIKELLPESLKTDPEAIKICDAAQPVFDRIKAAVTKLLLIPNIHQQPPEILEHLAWERNLEAEEGWELSDSEEQKIELILNAYEIQRYKGTRFAIIKSLQLLGINAEFQKWTEYGGDPYHFKIIINQSNAFSAEQLRLVERYISKTQAERDVGTIEIMFNVDSPVYFAAGCLSDFTTEVNQLITDRQYIGIGCHTTITVTPPLLN